MRIHTDTLTPGDLFTAATTARAELEYSRHGSRSRGYAFEVALRGESRRRPNFYNGDGQYAATWDQWGVFLSVLFDKDPNLTIPTAYTDAETFDRRTQGRFYHGLWPTDAHGDHTFRYNGTPYVSQCRKCSASQSWGA